MPTRSAHAEGADLGVEPPASAATRGGLPIEVPVLGLASWDAEDADARQGARFLALVDDVRGPVDGSASTGVEVRERPRALRTRTSPARYGCIRGVVPRCWRGRTQLGVVGEVLPAVARAWGFAGTHRDGRDRRRGVAGGQARRDFGLRAGAAIPVVPFDIAVVVPRRTPACARSCVRSSGDAVAGQSAGLHVFDVYEGAGIPEGQRSLALRCELFDRRAHALDEGRGRVAQAHHRGRRSEDLARARRLGAQRTPQSESSEFDLPDGDGNAKSTIPSQVRDRCVQRMDFIGREVSWICYLRIHRRKEPHGPWA